MENKPIILFTVFDVPAGDKRYGWLGNSRLPKDFISKSYHIVLRGRQIPKPLSWYDRIGLIIGGLKNPDPVTRKEELQGFDYMDKSSLEPIVKLVKQFKTSQMLV